MLSSPEVQVILLGGSSHAGKSSLAAAIASQLGWPHRSTDGLARHPGRPWKTASKPVPDHVAAHYADLSVDELLADVLSHYARLWPEIHALIAKHAAGIGAGPLVLEGSALWPATVAPVLGSPAIAAFWLSAPDQIFETRIHQNSNFAALDHRAQFLVSKFLARTLRFNTELLRETHRLGLTCLDVGQAGTAEDIAKQCLAQIGHERLISVAFGGQ